jgi:dihydroorotate dehydrogenase
MPDWSYHPLVRPALFCLPSETGRRAIIGILKAQAQVPGGEALFKLLAQADPPKALQTTFLGLEFPSPIGLGTGIDVDGRAARLLSQLGFGFLEIGPLGISPQPYVGYTNSRRIRRTNALAMSSDRGSPAVADVIGDLPPGDVPVALHVRQAQAVQTIEAGGEFASLFVLPAEVADSARTLRELRAATERPILVRILAGWDNFQIDRVVRNASATGIDAAMIVAGRPYPKLQGGEIVWNQDLSRALSVTTRVVESLPVALSGGVLTPQDASSAIDAGCRLISLSDGLVFAGPGLAKRINRQIETSTEQASLPSPLVLNPELDRRSRNGTAGALKVDNGKPSIGYEPPELNAVGVGLLGAFAAATAILGVAYCILSITVTLLPNETSYLGIGVNQLCAIDNCRLVEFMSHGRMSYAGTLMAAGVMLGWLTIGPVRRREPWAWWTMLLAGIAIYGSFLTFLAYGYLDAWHAVFVCVVSVVGVIGLVLSRPSLGRNIGPIAAFRSPAAHAWLWSPGGRGRSMIGMFAFGLSIAGASILVIASTDVFVPQDLAFIRLDAKGLSDISDRLIPLMAHDRAGFGGGMLALGILFGATAWAGFRPNSRGAWRAVAIAGPAFILPTLIIHLAIGYTSIVHLLPVYGGSILLIVALVTLHRPLHSGSYDGNRFDDI